jgi:sugar lactone lactonase YvrE
VAAFTFVASPSPAVQLNPGDLIVVDPHNQVLPGGGVLIAINPTTGAQTLIAATTLMEQPSGIAIEASGKIVVSDFGYFTDGGVFRVDPATGTQSLVSSGNFLDRPTGVAVDALGKIVVAQLGPVDFTGAALRIDPADGSQTVVSSGAALGATTGVAIDAVGDYLVANYQAGTGGSAIVRVDADTGAQNVVSAGGDLELGPMDVWVNNLQSDSILVTRATFPFTTGHVIEVDTVTGDQTVLSSGGNLMQPTGLTQDALGNIYVTDFGGGSARIVKIDPVTGNQTVISSGGFLSTPLDIVVYVPEPGPFVLLATAAAVGACRRFKRRAPHESRC